MAIEKLEYGKYYHLYNHAVGGLNLFRVPGDYKHFLSQYDKYISTIAETFAWVLMPNHFHLLVRIKEEDEIGFYKPLNINTADRAFKFETIADLSAFGEPESVDVNKLKRPNPTKHFSHLFNAHSKYINKRHETRGALFERSFKRKRIDNEEYLKRVVMYIHDNPVHHGFCEHPMDYPWSSYQACISLKPTKLAREAVIGWFDDEAIFKYMHEKAADTEEIARWLKIT